MHELLDHTKAFYLQKFGDDASNAAVFKKMKESKHDPVINEEDEDEDADEEGASAATGAATSASAEEEKKAEEATGVDDIISKMSVLSVREECDF